MATNFCPQCGSQVSLEDRFCPRCGAQLDEAAPRRRPVPIGGQSSKSTPPVSSLILLAIAVAGILLIGAGLLLRDDVPGEDIPTTVAEVRPTVLAPAATATASIPFPNVPRIGLQDAQERLEEDGAVFVDVRSAEQYASSHIPGALSIPLGASEMDPAYQELPQTAEIITYCT